MWQVTSRGQQSLRSYTYATLCTPVPNAHLKPRTIEHRVEIENPAHNGIYATST